MDFPCIEFTVVYANIAIAALVALVIYKEYRGLCTIISVIGLVGAIACAINLKVQSGQLFALGGIAPIGILMIVVVMNFIMEYSKCTEKVFATRVGSKSRKHSRGMFSEHYRIFIPTFSYLYKGNRYNSEGLLGYSFKKFRELYREDKVVTLYVNPKHPRRCIDKRYFPLRSLICAGVIGVCMILVSVVALFNV